MWVTPVIARLRIFATRTGGTITPGSDGNIGDTDVCQNVPTFLRAVVDTSYDVFHVTGVHLGSVRINTTGLVTITDMYPGSTLVAGNDIRIEMVHPVV